MLPLQEACQRSDMRDCVCMQVCALLQGNGGGYDVRCSAVLVSPTMLLTAAHCVGKCNSMHVLQFCWEGSSRSVLEWTDRTAIPEVQCLQSCSHHIIQACSCRVPERLLLTAAHCSGMHNSRCMRHACTADLLQGFEQNGHTKTAILEASGVSNPPNTRGVQL